MQRNKRLERSGMQADECGVEATKEYVQSLTEVNKTILWDVLAVSGSIYVRVYNL